MIVPFERVLGTFGGDAVSQDSVLALVTRCAASMNDYHVFESEMVRAIIQFKWDHYARSIFILQFALCMGHFLLVTALLVAVTPRMALPDPTVDNSAGDVFALLYSLGDFAIFKDLILSYKPENQLDFSSGLTVTPVSPGADMLVSPARAGEASLA